MSKQQITCAQGTRVVMKGATKTSNYDRFDVCRECKGHGVVEASNYPERGTHPENCTICKGSGKVQTFLNINIVPA